MSSPLTTSFSDRECEVHAGGAASILVANFSNITATTVAGEVTAIVKETGTQFYQYDLTEESIGLVESENHEVGNGSLFYEQILSASLNGLSAAKSQELRLLALNRLYIIVVKHDGTGIVVGNTKGAFKTGSNSMQTGTSLGDQSGYTLAFRAKELESAPTVDKAIVDVWATAGA